MHDRELAFFVKTLEAGHAPAESEMVVDHAQLFLRYAEFRTQLVISVISPRHERVQSVVPARELENHEDAAVGLALSRERGGSLPEGRNRQTCAGRGAEPVHPRAQQIAPARLRK